MSNMAQEDQTTKTASLLPFALGFVLALVLITAGLLKADEVVFRNKEAKDAEWLTHYEEVTVGTTYDDLVKQLGEPDTSIFEVEDGKEKLVKIVYSLALEKHGQVEFYFDSTGVVTDHKRFIVKERDGKDAR